MKTKKLTARQKRFADEYLASLNATKAYLTAYPNVKETTARQNGSKLLANDSVQMYIAEQQKKIQERAEISQDKIISELAAIAFADATDIAEILNGEVRVKDTRDLTETQRKAISGMQATKFGAKVEMADKLKALELLMRHFGMLTEKISVQPTEAKNKLDEVLAQLGMKEKEVHP